MKLKDGILVLLLVFKKVLRMLRLLFVFIMFAFCSQADGSNPDAVSKTPHQIRVINLQYILDNSIAVKNLREKIESMTKVVHDKMAQKELEFKKQEARLLELKNNLSVQEYEKELEIFNKKIAQAQKYAQQEKLKLEKFYSDGIVQVNEHTIEIIKAICQQQGCSIVLPTSQILYADESLNISVEVLEQLNCKITSININF